MTVAVVAGTRYDTALGATLLRDRGLSTVECAMADSPDEQDALQYENPGGLATAFHDRLGELRRDGSGLAMLFCNSLSAVVEHDDAVLPVVSPITVYREAVLPLRSSLVVTGNAGALLGVERTVRRDNPSHRMLGVSDPGLVRGIEAGDPEAAFAASPLPSTLQAAHRLGLEAVVLACTHFTSVLPYVRATCDLPIVDVGTRLIELTAARAASAS